MILYIENPKYSTHTPKNPIGTVSEFRKVAGYKINSQKPVAFYIPVRIIIKGK